ncbi:MAG: TonB-dependent receptor, partial [Paludibacteraceae bacterium]|nr:TonB-dependent receptor [Paludibacteraceae bacterium]
HIGYLPYKQTIESTNSDTLVIELSSSNQLLPEVLVSGNGYLLQKQTFVPLTVQSVSDKELRHYLGGSLMQSIERMSGVSAMQIGSGQSKPVIRGLGFNRLVVVENGIKHEGQQWAADHGLEIDQFAVHHIEIVKGPAALGYGAEAIAGVIALTHDSVPKDNGMRATWDMVGKSNNQLLGSSLQLAYRKNRIFFTLRGTLIDYADFRVTTDSVAMYSYKVGLHNKQLRNTAGKEKNLHTSVGYTSSNLTTRFYVSNMSSKTGFFANAHGLEPRRVNEIVHDASDRDILFPYSEVHHLKITNQTEWLKDNFKVQAQLGFQRNFRQEMSAYVSHGYMPAVFPDNMPFSSSLEREFDKYIYTANVRMMYQFASRFSIVAGNQLDYQHNAINGRGFILPAFTKFADGVYALALYTPSLHSTWQGGIRYDYGSIRTTAYADWYKSPTVESASLNEWDYIERASAMYRQFNAFSWSMGYRYSKDILELKWNIGKSFRMPDAKELAANGVNYHQFSYEKGDASLQPEIAYQLDGTIGFATSKCGIQTTPFINYFSNYIYLNPTANHDWLYGNGNQVFEYSQAAVLRYGTELDAHYQLFKPLSVAFTAEMVVARQLSGEKKGYSLPFSPPHSVIFSVQYQPEKWMFFTNPYIGFDWRLVATQTHIVPPEEITQGYNTLDARLGSDFSFLQRTVSLSIQIQNMLNTRYFNHASYYRLINVPEPGTNLIVNLRMFI